ncbi:MAG: response regulator transcription factor [Chitinophagales bacterium]|nr:response regulator transcription factor [Chitinophagales bacterium]
MPGSITCVIVDDEVKAGQLLADMLLQLYPEICLLGVYNTWDSALAGIRANKPNVLFLDISMPEKTGFELLELLPENQSEVIFVTAHPEFALDAFNFDVCDYILKPASHKKLLNSVSRAIKRLENKGLIQKESNHGALSSKIGVPDQSGVKYINVDDILFLESVNGCAKVVMKEGHIVSSYHLSRFYEVLNKRSFVQVHRSYIVNVAHVTRYDSSGTVIMDNDISIPVSRNHKDNFLKIIGKVTK